MVERFVINYDARGEQVHPSGDFVHYSDYAELEAENERLKKQRDYWQSQHDERTRQLGHSDEALSRTGAVKVKALEWHEKLKRGERDGFVCSLGGVLAYSIMLSSFRVYGIEGEYDGAAEFETLETAKAAAQQDYERRILSAL